MHGIKTKYRINGKCGICIDELRCIGGGSNSRLWLQMKADITGKKVKVMEVGEAGCLGAAILAGMGYGIFTSIETAVNKFVKTKEEFTPDALMYEKYNRIFDKYRNLYEISRNLFGEDG